MTTKYGLPEEVKFCTRCTISNQRPNSCIEYEHSAESAKQTIHFDEEGVCDACRVAEAKATIDWAQREAEFRRLVKSYKRTDGGYDCIVPGSGGKDSFFAAIKAREFGLNPLLVTWAPHLYTDWGRRNLEAWQKLGDHLLMTPNRETHRMLTRLAVENLFHPFQPFIIGQKAFAPKIAYQLGIPLVLYGEDEAEYGNPRADIKTAARGKQYFSAEDEIMLSGCSMSDLLAHGLKRDDLQPYLPLTPKEAAFVDCQYMGYFFKWHPQGAFYAATEHGFEPAPERTPGTYSKYNSLDDMADDLHYWTTYQKFGIGRATYDTAQEIRSGEITREEGVALVQRFDGEYPERFEPQMLDYLSVNGFSAMTRERLFMLAERFRSPHLWDGDALRYVVT